MAKVEVEIVADDEEIGWRYFIERTNGGESLTNFIIEGLGFDIEAIDGRVVVDLGVEFGVVFESELIKLGVKIEGEEAKVVACEIVILARVAKTDDNLHGSFG